MPLEFVGGPMDGEKTGLYPLDGLPESVFVFGGEGEGGALRLGFYRLAQNASKQWFLLWGGWE